MVSSFFSAKFTYPIMKQFIGGNVMKITDMVISAILKKGILYEARNVDTDVEIPMVIENQECKIKVNIKCEHMTLRIEKDEKTGA